MLMLLGTTENIVDRLHSPALLPVSCRLPAYLHLRGNGIFQSSAALSAAISAFASRVTGRKRRGQTRFSHQEGRRRALYEPGDFVLVNRKQ